MVRSYKSGFTVRMLLNDSSVHKICSYMSSVAINTSGYLRNTAPRAANSALL